MTKVTILGQEPKEEKKLKPIEFVKYLCKHRLELKQQEDTYFKPKDWKNIELICLNYNRHLDLMFAYNSDRSDGVLYVGHFNDGVVE